MIAIRGRKHSWVRERLSAIQNKILDIKRRTQIARGHPKKWYR
jgi:hypothetical protein